MDKKRSKICQVLCNKEECSELQYCTGKQNSRCKQIGKSFLCNMNDNQVDYVICDLYQNVFLKACPGSGKTEVLAIKAAYENENWKLTNQGYAILTFTNSAENEIASRIETYLNGRLGYPHYLGTFTSWLHGYIANPFLHKLTGYKGDDNKDKSIRIIESNCNSEFLNAYSCKYSYDILGHIKANEFFRNPKDDKFIYCGSRVRNGNDILHELLDKDSWREKELSDVKERFLKSGFALYEDIEYTSYLLLREYPEIAKYIAKRFPIIFVDECQDLSFGQLGILEILNENGCKIHLIGDLNQAIYAFRDIQPEDTKDFIKQLDFKTTVLNENYRSCQSIVNASEYIVNGAGGIVGRNESKVSSPLIAILYSKGEERQAVERFDKYVEDNNLNRTESRIIVRNNSLKNKILGLKNQNQSINVIEQMALVVYLLDNGEEVNNFKVTFEILARNIQRIFYKASEHLNSSFFYRPKELEASEWKGLLLEIQNILKECEELKDFSVTWKEWKKRLTKLTKDKISNIQKLKTCSYDLGALRKLYGDKKVEDTLFGRPEGELSYAIETIHGCKGMSLDAVFFISAYQASNDEHSGGYWKQWFDLGQIGEENRLAYVAFSRARYLLAIGIPKTKTFSDEDRKILEKAGFEVVEC